MNFNSLTDLQNEVITCRKCPRLVTWREQVGMVKRRAYREETYWARPVPGFGDPDARVLVVGLAPGAHGSNRTGRMFTGDDSGNFLYPALWRAGFANQPNGSSVSDGLKLKKIWITAVCRCVPPDNKPTRDEITNCKPYLEKEMELLQNICGIVALGRIVWEEMLKQIRPADGLEIPAFGHGVLFRNNGDHPWMLASYHPSRQNTQTGRLTEAMFDEIWDKVNQLLMD